MNERLIKERTLELLKEKERRQKYNKLSYLFPDQPITDYLFAENNTIYSRNEYAKQIRLFNASKDHDELIFIGPNGSGKTMAGGYFDTVHLTGRYPTWWVGHKWTRPIKMWAAGISSKPVRDGIQTTLFGKTSDPGSGLIPKECIIATRPKPNSPGCIESAQIRHESGGISEIYFKSYDEEIASYSGASDIDLIHLDEEPPIGIDAECTARIFRTRGKKISTFTPDKGLSETILQLFPDGDVKEGVIGLGRFCVHLDMDDVPHYTDEWKLKLFNALPPHVREAKFFGRIAIGSGLVYPISEYDIKFKPSRDFPSLKLPRAYGMDPGWVKTAVVWGAYDEIRDIWYIYDEYLRGQENGSIHASAVKSRGSWMYGIIDKAADSNNSPVSKEKALEVYLDHGLNLHLSPRGKLVEENLAEVWQYFSTGRLLISEHCQNLFKELRLYRRDDKMQIVTSRGKDGTGHDLLDAMRYLICNGKNIVRQNPNLIDSYYDELDTGSNTDHVTGY